VSAGPVGGRVDCGSEASYIWLGNEAVILVLEEGPRNCTSTFVQQLKWTEQFTTIRSEEIVIIIDY
jgi:hypothetical protein